MVINAFNSGARIYMADFEDANSPTWANVVGGQQNLTDAIERTISLEQGEKSYALNDEVAVLLVRPRGWHLQERHVEVDGKHVSAGLFDFGVYLAPQRRAAARARHGAVLLPPEAREPPRGAALERRLLLRPGSARDPARDDQGDRPHRDDPRGVRDGGDPLRAPRALGRAQRRPLGLHLLGHQEVPRAARVRPPRPRAGDDDRAVHARVHGAPRAHVPPARCARDRRHGRVHPEPARSRGERGRARARDARTSGASRRTASTGPGSRTRTSCRSRWPSSTPCSASGRTSSSGCARTSRRRRRIS